MPRFVILEHDHPFLHWDLMLESGEKLLTWRLLQEPGPGKKVAAEPLGEHRKIYLDHEGPLSGNRGSVKRWDSGSFEWRSREEDRLEVSLAGQRLRGGMMVRQVEDGWLVSFTG